MRLLNSVFIVFFLSFFLVSCTSSSLPDAFSSYPLKMTDLKTALFYEYSNSSETLTIKERSFSSDESAIEFMDEQAVLFYSIFEPQRVSYPGPTTKNIICPDEFKPVKTVIEQPVRLIFYRGFANANQVWGACSNDSIAYKSVRAFLYCQKTKSLYTINYFVQPEQDALIDSFVEGLNCE
ncbi:MAG: hypothetical protein KC535_04660 [Nanoarchaeota archaeon]|nr:hypothetical protein [Nanoarchaeota archaeon]